MKRALALALTAAMLCAVIVCFPAVVAAAKTTVTNVQPAILADVGETVTFSNYSVEFSDGTVDANCTIKQGSSVKTSFVPASVGATAFTATNSVGTKTKNIYVVAKNPSDDDYVIYENDFESSTALSDMGMTAAASTYTLANGKLTINGTSSNPRIYLPAWLADFGNYRYDVVGTQTDPADSGRWFSLVFRAQNMTASGTSKGSPYMHMCVRNAATAAGTATTGGVEAVIYTGSQWSYLKSTGYTENISATKNYKFSVLAKDSVVQYRIDDNVVIHLTNTPKVSNATTYCGGLGLIGNSSKFVVDSVRVSIIDEVPEYKAPAFTQVTDPVSRIYNAPANIAIIDEVDDFNDFVTGTRPSNALMYVNDSGSVTGPSGTVITTLASAYSKLGSKIIPAFYVKTKAAADKVAAFLKSNNVIDVMFISDSAEVAKYCRGLNPLYRCAVDFSGAYTASKLTDAQLLDIRRSVNGALSTVAVLPSKYATQHNVEYLRDLNIVVWAIDTDCDDTDIARMVVSGASGIISDEYDDVYDECNELFLPHTLTITPSIIGHRGNPTQAPENSITSYLKAVENGADVVETDIQLTKDGAILVMHDDSIDRTTSYNGTAKVSEMTLAEIKQYNLWGQSNQYKNIYPDEKVPTFEEMLIALKDSDCKIFVEIKTGNANIVKPMVDMITKYGYEDRVCVICFTASQLTLTQKHMPGMSTGYLLNAISTFRDPAEMAQGVYTVAKSIQSCSSSFNPNYGNLTEAFINAMTYRGTFVWPWTYATSSAAAANNMFLYGGAGLTTNDSQYYKNTVKKISASTDAVYLADVGSEKALTVNSVTYGGTVANITANSSTGYTVIDGDDVISISGGKLKALKKGTADIMAYFKAKLPNGTEYVLYTQVITISVGGEAPSKLALSDSSNYVIDDVLTGVEDDTTVEKLLENFAAGDVKVYNANGVLLEGNKLVGTNATVRLMNGDTELDSISVLVLGDVNGDGKVDAKDYVLIKRMCINLYNAEGLYKAAALVTGTSDKVRAQDYLLVKRHVLNIANIYD